MCPDEVNARAFFTDGLTALTYGHFPAKFTEPARQGLFEAIARLSQPEAQCHGIKTAVGELKLADDVVRSLRDELPSLSIINLERADYLHRAVSWATASLGSQFHHFLHETERKVPRIWIDPKMFQVSYFSDQAVKAKFAQLAESHRYLHLHFEELQQSPATFFDRVTDFLDVSPFESKAAVTRKVVKDKDPLAHVVNRQQISRLNQALIDGKITQAPRVRGKRFRNKFGRALFRLLNPAHH